MWVCFFLFLTPSHPPPLSDCCGGHRRRRRLPSTLDLSIDIGRSISPLSSYYQDVELEKDYICSLPKDSGMHRCENFPPTRYNGMICNGSAPTANSNNEPNNSNCINWNQYYTSCRPSDKNPFQGAISFDNIGLAWVAIFLVSVNHDERGETRGSSD